MSDAVVEPTHAGQAHRKHVHRHLEQLQKALEAHRAGFAPVRPTPPDSPPQEVKQ